MRLGALDDPGKGRWRRIAALPVLAGGLADAGIAHPDRLAIVELVPFASGLGSAVLFLASGSVTRPRLVTLALVALASTLAILVDASMGLAPPEWALAVIDVCLRIALVVSLVVLALRHFERSGTPTDRSRKARPRGRRASPLLGARRRRRPRLHRLGAGPARRRSGVVQGPLHPA